MEKKKPFKKKVRVLKLSPDRERRITAYNAIVALLGLVRGKHKSLYQATRDRISMALDSIDPRIDLDARAKIVTKFITAKPGRPGFGGIELSSVFESYLPSWKNDLGRFTMLCDYLKSSVKGGLVSDLLFTDKEDLIRRLKKMRDYLQ